MRLPLGLLLLTACAGRDQIMRLEDLPPETPTGNTVDDYHGTKVPDPYRWLENIDSPEVVRWTDAQREHTERFLSRLPARSTLRERLTELWRYERRSAPERHGTRWVWFRNDGLQNHDVAMVGDGPMQNGRVLIDPNTLSADGTVALGALSFTRDGSKLAYSLSKSGSDWQEWHVLDVASGSVLADVLHWSKFSGAAWTKDNRGFFYQRYPTPKPGEERQAITEKPQLCFHELGKPQADDQVIYERPDEPKWGFEPTVSDDGRFLIVSIWTGTDRKNRIAYLDLESPDAGIKPLLMDFDAGYRFVESRGTRLYFWTDLLAPRGSVVAFEIDKPQKEHWQTIVRESNERLEEVRLIGGKLFTSSLRDAHSVLRVWSLEGLQEAELALPGLGTAGRPTGHPDDGVAYFTFSTFTTPSAIHCWEIAAKRLVTVWTPTVAFDPQAFVAKEVFYQSKDGARVPLFLVHRRDLVLDGRTPTYLTAYGGFGAAMTPQFSREAIAWLEHGGLFALASVRGGSEYGESWHEAGMLERKQNVFDDFCAAAEYLIRNSYTSPRHLGIVGASNGGLLVGACLVQRPELFGAAVPEVGVLDMLRFQEFTIGWAWTTEYGSSADPEQFPVLLAYSPLHNVKPGVAYPATLLKTSDHDDRVMPAHSYKFAAAMQNAAAPGTPVLLRVEKEAGHSAGLATLKQIESSADTLAFLLAELGANG